jgi:hypothetical protein
MTQPTGFEDPEIAGKVCKLLESIYGLKHASRSWNLRFDKEVKTLTLSYAKKNLMCTEKLVGVPSPFLILYVDDILLIENDIPLFLQLAKSSLKKVFLMKDLGEAVYILDIKIYRDRLI